VADIGCVIAFFKEEAWKMRNTVTVIVLLLVSLSTVCSVNAYVYFVEAENFDPDNSEPVAAGCAWSTAADKDTFNNSYMLYSGPHAGANTSLLYPLPNVGKDTGPWMVWVRCTMPDGGSDSYFFYVSTDGGEKWGPQQTAHGGGVWEDWRWQGWALSTPLKKGDDNVLRISERENAKADVICIRNDGMTPTDEEYEKWQEEHKVEQFAVEALHKIATTWGGAKVIRSAP
jgi:hypothetical protein